MKDCVEIVHEFIQKIDLNFYVVGIPLTLDIFGHKVDVESIYESEDKIYVHVGCPEFEGDLNIDSLSDENQERISETLSKLVEE